MNGDGQILLIVSIHFRRLKRQFHLNRLMKLKEDLMRKLEKNGVKALVIAGDFNLKPEAVKKCFFKPDTFMLSIRTSDRATTQKLSCIDNIIVNNHLTLLNEVEIDAKSYFSHHPLFGSIELK